MRADKFSTLAVKLCCYRLQLPVLCLPSHCHVRAHLPLPHLARAPAHITSLHSCYNNCPNDPRASSAQSQVTIYCAQASAHPSATTAKPAASSSMTEEAVASGSGSPATTKGSKPTVTLHNNKASSSSTASNNPQSTGSAAELVRNTGGALLAVAGVIAAMF